MRRHVLVLALASAAFSAQAQSGYKSPYGSSYASPYGTRSTGGSAYGSSGSHYVAPSVRQDGTFVEGHRRTNPDGNPYNNWSTQGNVNPYTGKAGTRNPYKY